MRAGMHRIASVDLPRSLPQPDATLPLCLSSSTAAIFFSFTSSLGYCFANLAALVSSLLAQARAPRSHCYVAFRQLTRFYRSCHSRLLNRRSQLFAPPDVAKLFRRCFCPSDVVGEAYRLGSFLASLELARSAFNVAYRPLSLDLHSVLSFFRLQVVLSIVNRARGSRAHAAASSAATHCHITSQWQHDGVASAA